MTTALDYAKSHRDRFTDQLLELLRIPSVSTLPDHAEDVRRAAEWLAADMVHLGLTAEVVHAPPHHPLVYGEWLGAGPDAPTVLIYCHFDVQPAALEDGWQTDPFQPVERDGRIYARGAVDSKSHVIANLKAVEALLNADDPCPVNVKLLFEGEEETDSSHIFRFVRENKARLGADVCIVSDGSMPDPDTPVLTYGLRGIMELELTVSGPKRDLHSGQYGGNVHNPIQALAEILAQLHDADGRVAVPGFYDDVPPFTDEERTALADIQPMVEAEWHRATGAPQPWGEPDYHLHERAMVRPTLEINGIAGGFFGPGFKTVLPSKAIAKISCRLVPEQDPQRIYQQVCDHITTLTPPTVRTSFTWLDGAPAVLLALDTPAMQAAIAAYERGWGVRPLLHRAGGSVPVVAGFQHDLQVPLALLGYGYKGGGAHGPNEYAIVDMFYRGIDTTIHFCQQFAALFHDGAAG